MKTLSQAQAETFRKETMADIEDIAKSMLSLAKKCAKDPDALEQIYLTLTETARMCQAMLSIFA